MKTKNLTIVATIAFAMLVSVFAFRPGTTSASSDPAVTATPKKRKTVSVQSPRTIQSPRTGRNPAPTPSPEAIQSPRSMINPAPTPSPETIQSPKPKTKQRSGARSTGRRTAKPRN